MPTEDRARAKASDAHILESGSGPSAVVCPDCGGYGSLTATVGGYFDRSFGNYLPLEREVCCERCGGSGEIEVENAAF